MMIKMSSRRLLITTQYLYENISTGSDYYNLRFAVVINISKCEMHTEPSLFGSLKAHSCSFTYGYGCSLLSIARIQTVVAVWGSVAKSSSETR